MLLWVMLPCVLATSAMCFGRVSKMIDFSLASFKYRFCLKHETTWWKLESCSIFSLISVLLLNAFPIVLGVLGVLSVWLEIDFLSLTYFVTYPLAY